MKTQLEHAKSGTLTEEMQEISGKENININLLCKRIASGEIVIMLRKGHNVAIGTGLKTKVNANLGSSTESKNDSEIQKAVIAEKYGTDTICDMSMSGNINKIRSKIFNSTTVPITTVPIYQAIAENSFDAGEEKIIGIIERQADSGVSSFVIHAALTREMLSLLKERKKQRIMGVVSKGGAMTAAWMFENSSENPFLKNFNKILEIMRKKDVVLSLGNAMRSGCVHDEMDNLQKTEAELNAKLARAANDAGVQVIVEGMGGHVAANNIFNYVKYYKKITHNRPLFVAGPLPMDIAVGYDHVAACVGGAMASGAGADYLCYITPSEHLGLPGIEQVKEGIIACKIAAHIGDSMKLGLSKSDLALSEMRKIHDWEGQFEQAIDKGERARKYHKNYRGACTMCGKYCAIDVMDKYLKN
ncbi:phosphomethylpyrimidine synthase [Candidatus Altiarchaeales archaeon WOR_SM1_SCG]|nr:phosphomethylpyrimidine synthase [Candidatus Altiarchaeales archaeon WOR_SM1_SCG]